MKFWTWESWKQLVGWGHREVRESANNLMRDFRSLRSLFNFLYLLLYMFLCVWAALYYAKECLNTAIMSTASIVMAIFTAYVWSSSKDKELGLKPISPVISPKQVNEEEDGSSD
jgi:hypothetical protein